MQIIKKVFDLNKAINSFKDFGFVPTMGGIHNGHISLIKKSQKKCKKTIVSIFINPTQFNSKNDYKNYPRNIIKDIKLLKKMKVDFVFIPKSKEIYKKKFGAIKINKSDKILCAAYRKGHFEGVLNVMNRLLYLIKAKNVFMGEKDFQQLFLIKKYLSKKHKVNIINCKTIRDENHVALSTRNNLLSKKKYSNLIKIINEFKKLKKKLLFKNNYLKIYLKKVSEDIEKKYKISIDYLEIRDEKKLKIITTKKKFRLFVAFWIGRVRLIDNY